MARISARGNSVPPSPIRKLAPLAAEAKSRGLKVYHLNIGQPDIESPKEFFEGLREFKDSVLAYENSKGSNYLCQAWSSYMNKTLGVHTSEQNFLITCGASEALLYAFMACCDPGDEILTFDPTYANYIGLGVCADVKIIGITSSLENNFALPSRSQIESAITPKTRAILLCNPNNPTGTVYSTDELKVLLAICNEKDIFLIADETYREFAYDGLKLSSVLHLEPKNERLIIIDSLSKRFSLCGARIGCLITTNQSLLNSTHRMAQMRLAAPSAEQFAAAYMLERIKGDFIENVRVEYQKRRDTLYSGLKAIKGVEVHKSQGAFYTICGLPVKSGEEFATFLLTKFQHKGATTFIAPASGFYTKPNSGLNQARLAYVLDSKDINSALDCLAQALQQI